MGKIGVKLWPPEIAALDALKRDVKAIYGVKVTREDVAGALAHGVSVHQLVGMLAEFHRHDDWNKDAPTGTPPEPDE
jgi:hypothetical protein